jgi:hypothetical protein
MINTEVIEALKPCEERFNNFKKFYDNRDFTMAQFLGLKNITHSDKIWVAMRLMPTPKLRF